MQILAVVSALMYLVAVGSAQAQPASSWRPDHTVRLVLPAAAGGSFDIVGRILAQELGAEMGQQFIVINRPGANGSIAITEALRAEPDGHTLIMVTTTMVAVNPALFKDIRYDAVKDFAAVGTIAVAPAVLVATPSFPANNLQELVAVAKSKPGEFNYASSGAGAFSNLTFEMLKERAGIRLTHVPFKGEADALIEIMAGRVPVSMLTLGGSLSLLNDKKIKALGILSPQRISALPDVPTLEEQGLAGFNPQLWYGLVVAKDTSSAVVTALNQALNKVLARPDIRANFEKQGLVLLSSTPAELAARIAADIPLYGAIVKSAGIKVE